MSVSMYCSKCKYDLKGLTEHRCPECGQPFEPDNPMTYVQCPWVHQPRNILVGLVLILLVIFWCVIEGRELQMFFDLDSFIWVFGIVAAGLWMCFGPVIAYRAIMKALFGVRHQEQGWYLLFQSVLARGYQLAWAAGLSGTLMGIINMLQNMDDPSAIGPGMAYSLFTTLYGLFLAEFIFSPLQQAMASRANTTLVNVPGHRSQRSMLPFGVAIVTLIGMTFWVCVIGLMP